MKLPTETFRRLLLGLSASLALSGCAMFSGQDDGLARLAAAPANAPPLARGAGPAADYPVVVGETYRVGSTVYIPADTLNYDEVGYVIPEAGTGVTAAHHTMPLPSYAEVTSLDTGRTILVRVERRGPMTSEALIALSPMALNQLGGSTGTPVRVRRVNPPEEERAMLRLGQSVPNRMNTPESLVAVLKRNLPAGGSTQVASTSSDATPRPLASVQVAPSQAARQLPPIAAAQSAGPSASAVQAPAARVLPRPALPPLGTFQRMAPSAPQTARQPTVVARLPQVPPSAASRPVAAEHPPQSLVSTSQVPPPSTDGAFVVQVAALTSLEGAQRVAGAIGGRISQAGSFYRIRTGPFATRGQAEASLAKVRAAGYSEAQIFTNG